MIPAAQSAEALEQQQVVIRGTTPEGSNSAGAPSYTAAPGRLRPAISKDGSSSEDPSVAPPSGPPPVEPVQAQPASSVTVDSIPDAPSAMCQCGIFKLLLKGNPQQTNDAQFLSNPQSPARRIRGKSGSIAPEPGFDLSGLDIEQQQRLKRAFELFDKDGSGTIDRNELVQVLRVLGHNPTKGEFSDLLKTLDTNRNNCIDFSEFATAWWRQEQASKEASFQEQLDLAFGVFDVDGDGNISAAELRSKLTTLGDVMTEQEVSALILEVDRDKSGMISMAEFRAMPCWQV